MFINCIEFVFGWNPYDEIGCESLMPDITSNLRDSNNEFDIINKPTT